MCWQIPIVTEGKHTNSRIISVNTDIIKKFLNQNFVVVIPGFQGINEQLRINTLGRRIRCFCCCISKMFKRCKM